ncbi:5'-nucleotidase, lipoprotein e(P4) family [Pseudoneobacillus sp. C159]
MKKLWFSTVIFVIMLSFNTRIVMGAPAEELMREQNTMSVLWFHTSAEAKALYYQGYNIGKMRLDEILAKKPNSNKKLAIILDLDETVLDNSPYFAHVISNQQGKGTLDEFYQWFNLGKAKALPGAVEFLNYADSKSVEIFYISNRYTDQINATIQNLRAIGAPQANPQHVLLLDRGEKGKEKRRQAIAQTHEVVLLFGDNIGDFKDFRGTPAERVRIADQLKDEFGKKFIVFPNPMYGDWESSIYQYNHNLPLEELIKLRKKALTD